IYELARKHCGHQRQWRVSVETLLKKSGSSSPRRVFRAMLREIIRKDSLPDYHLAEEPGDLIVVRRADPVIDEGRAGQLRPETLDEARATMPGADVYALEAEWRTFAARTPPRDPDAAFLGWVRKRPDRR
ncbi:MAG: replication initiator protein A, partial [Paracoccaceae bacterium]|nr:replication initiator protein A [Paracoccaceae bacterium]